MIRSHRHKLRVISSLSLGVAFLLAGSACAKDPDEAMIHDLWQTVQARKALLDDPQLAALNLGVKVSNGIAVLWGPVPSQILSFRAEQRLRAIVELTEVRNQMVIEPDDAAAPQGPRYLPDAPVPAPLQPAPEPRRAVILAGIITPEETLTARSSPVGLHNPAAGSNTPTVRLPFLGSITFPQQ
jgi:BON domain-containing protein